MSNLIKGQTDKKPRRKNKKSPNLIEDMTRAANLMESLQEFAICAARANSRSMCWTDAKNLKWLIVYDYKEKRFVPGHAQTTRFLGMVPFTAREDVEKAIKVFEKELDWYFNEYLKSY